MTSERAAASGQEIAFSTLRGIRPYRITRASGETLESWRGEVDKFITEITDDNILRLRKLLTFKGQQWKYTPDVEKFIQEMDLDEKDIQLLAIGLFILREKSAWSNFTAWKVFKGGTHNMERAFEPDGLANCYDVASIAQELAIVYGMRGSVKRHFSQHGYMETEDGKVSDIMWGPGRGGLFQISEYQEEKKTQECTAAAWV